MADFETLIHQRVLDAARQYPNRIAVIEAGRTTEAGLTGDAEQALQSRYWTYGELATQATRVAAALPEATSVGRSMCSRMIPFRRMRSTVSGTASL